MVTTTDFLLILQNHYVLFISKVSIQIQTKHVGCMCKSYTCTNQLELSMRTCFFYVNLNGT